MFSKKKRSESVKTMRTADVVAQEYSNTAAQIGHKMSMITQFEQEITDLSAKLVALRHEKALPAEKPAPAAASTNPPVDQI